MQNLIAYRPVGLASLVVFSACSVVQTSPDTVAPSPSVPPTSSVVAPRATATIESSPLPEATATNSSPQLTQDIAQHWVIGGDGVVLGSIIDGKWIRAGETDALPVPGTAFRVYHADGHYMSTTQRLGDAAYDESGCTRVDLRDDYTGVPTIALSGSWESQPASWELLYSQSDVYDRTVLDHLEAQGQDDPTFRVYDVAIADFDQNGTDEVVLTANFYETLSGSGYEQSIVLFRQARGNEVATIQLLPNHEIESEDPSVTSYGIFGLLDANGDGDLEIVLEGRIGGVPGAWIFEIDADGPREVLSVRCALYAWF